MHATYTPALLWVGLGGLLGSLARYGLGVWIQAHTQRYATAALLPWHTLAVNVLGCLLIGLLAGLAAPQGQALAPALRLFLFTGVLGGFTTFSAFGLETVQLLTQGQWLAATVYVGASVLLGLAAVATGLWLGGAGWHG